MSPKKIMFCEDCTLMGVPVPENNDTCGNCGSHSVTVYEPVSGLTPDAQDGVTGAATLSGLYNCNVCGQEKCVEPGICDDCLAPPTEFEINQWRDGEATPPVI